MFCVLLLFTSKEYYEQCQLFQFKVIAALLVGNTIAEIDDMKTGLETEKDEVASNRLL